MKKQADRRRKGNSHLPVSAAPFASAAALCLAGLVTTYVFFVKSTTGQFLDESALVEAAVARRFLGSQSAQILDLLPVTSAVIAAFVVLFVTLARRRWKAAGIALAAMAAANLSTQLIKAGLPNRPDMGVTTLALNSLPSGHSTLAASAAAAVFLVVSPRWRPATAFLGSSYAVLAGISTLINQWHRPADVLAAFFLVSIWTLAAAWLILRCDGGWNVWLGSNQHWATSRWWVVISGIFTLLAATATALLLHSVSGNPTNSTTRYFLSGVGAIVAAGYGLALAGILFMNHQVRRR